MEILVLGGTGWLSSTVARTAVREGHAVTVLCRGRAGPVPAGVRFVRGDRDQAGAYRGLDRQTFDAVVDVAREPAQVRAAVAALAGRVRRYLYISSISAYADQSRPGAQEDAELLAPLAADRMSGPGDYGPAKVACEQAVQETFGAAAVLVRLGLVAGPGDDSDRTGYWPWRFARPATADGTVLVPQAAGRTCQLLDVRDAAGWLLSAAGRDDVSGAVDLAGDPVALEQVLTLAREVAGHRGALVTADDQWLTGHGVQPWAGPRSLPLWLPDPAYAGMGDRPCRPARRTGLAPRPLRDTLGDLLGWELGRQAGRTRAAGLSDREERELLAELTG